MGRNDKYTEARQKSLAESVLLVLYKRLAEGIYKELLIMASTWKELWECR